MREQSRGGGGGDRHTEKDRQVCPQEREGKGGREPLSWVFLWGFLVPASARWVWSPFSEFSDHFLLRKEEIRIVELWFVLIRKKLSNINLPVSAGKALKRPGKKKYQYFAKEEWSFQSVA